MALKPEASLMTGLSIAALVYAIHSNATPTQADIRVGDPNDANIEKNERTATWLSVGIVSGVSLVAKDPTIFIIGGLATVVMAWWTRYNNAVSPQSDQPSMENAQIKAVPPMEADYSDLADIPDVA